MYLSKYYSTRHIQIQQLNTEYGLIAPNLSSLLSAAGKFELSAQSAHINYAGFILLTAYIQPVTNSGEVTVDK